MCGFLPTTPAGILFCGALLVLAGCATPPSSEPPGEFVMETNAAPSSSLNWTNPSATNLFPRPAAQKPAPRPVQSNKPPVIVRKPAALAVPVTTWSSLNRWAAAHRLAAARRISNQPVAAYALGSSNGTLVLAIGTRTATWNGVEMDLGFPPEFIDGEVYVHGQDLAKSLEPLLCEPPLQFGARPTVVIDPGHGGSNVGTQSALDGRFEKEFTLDWALRLKPLLETNGWTVFLTRTGEVTVSNYSRVVFAETHHADLFISLHFNSTPDRSRKTGGLETYCITPVGMPSTLTRGYADPWYEVLTNNAFDAQNLQLAVRVHGTVLRATGLEDRGVRHSRFETVLKGQNRPAVLVEGGYLSNPREAALIESPEYRQKLAEGVAEALALKNEDGK